MAFKRMKVLQKDNIAPEFIKFSGEGIMKEVRLLFENIFLLLQGNKEKKNGNRLF